MIPTKATAIANSNTALIKYWGKKNEEEIIPMNNSISITTDALSTTTTVEFSDDFTRDEFKLNGKKQAGTPFTRVENHLTLLRKIVQVDSKAKVHSNNNFPTAAGLASSASGFAALTYAAANALGLDKDLKELSMISRQGSGSSCRSFYGGYVEWIAKDEKGDSFAIQLADENWFDVRDIVVVLKSPERKLNTREAMKLSMKTSPFFSTRIETIEENLSKIRKAIESKDFTLLGKIAEMDCLSMHSVAITSDPPLIFWTPETVKVMHFVEALRNEDLEAYYTIDTGANMHILTKPKYEKEIIQRLEDSIKPERIISSKSGKGVSVSSKHLF